MFNTLKDKRTFKYGGFSIVITVLVIIAVLAVNILATVAEKNNGLRVDFTPTASYTLDKNAEAAISDLDTEVIIYTFIPSNSASTYSYLTENIVAVFDGASDKITSRNVDPIVNPSKLEQFSTNTKQLSAYAVVVAQKDDETNFHAYNESELVEYNSRTSKNYFVLQRWLTSALMYMRTGIRQNVYVLTGHGENTGDEMQTVFNRIRRENYNVEEINLISGQQTLSQGDILVMLQPKSDLTKDEFNIIIDFLDDSYGDLLFVAQRLTDDGGEPLKNYVNLLEYFNISLSDGVVAETDENHRSAQNSKLIELIADQEHEISSAVRASNEPVWVSDSTAFEYKYLSGTTMSAYDESFFAVLTSYSSSLLVPWNRADNFTEDDYEKGKRDVVCAYQRQNTELTGTSATTSTRILLMGADSFVTGDYLGNTNILRNGVNWLAGRSTSDTVQSLGIDLTASYVQMSQMQMKVWFAVLVMAVPVIILSGGIVVWIKRKNL